jgi:hypothetical protein
MSNYLIGCILYMIGSICFTLGTAFFLADAIKDR